MLYYRRNAAGSVEITNAEVGRRQFMTIFIIKSVLKNYLTDSVYVMEEWSEFLVILKEKLKSIFDTESVMKWR